MLIVNLPTTGLFYDDGHTVIYSRLTDDYENKIIFSRNSEVNALELKQKRNSIFSNSVLFDSIYRTCSETSAPYRQRPVFLISLEFQILSVRYRKKYQRRNIVLGKSITFIAK